MKRTTHIRPVKAVVLLAAAAALFGLAGTSAAAPLPPTAPAVTAGNYSVTPNGCNDYLRVMGCLRTWVEEKAEPNGSFRESSGVYTNKAPGTYTYRSGDHYCGVGVIGCTTRRGPTVTVTVVANAPQTEPLEAQQRYGFRVRAGNVTGSSGKDLLVERISGGTPGDGVLSAVLLEQVSGGFTPRVPTYAQRVSSAWANTSIGAEVEDLDVDGFVDVMLTGVKSAIPGLKDQIVLSPGVIFQSKAKAVHPVDATMLSFTEDVLDYMVDNSYFRNNAPMMYYMRQVYAYQCSQGVYYSYANVYDSGWNFDCYWHVMNYYVVGQNYSGFDSGALMIWQLEAAVDEGRISSYDAVDAIASVAEAALRYPIGGMSFHDLWSQQQTQQPLPTTDVRRGLEAFLAILGISRAGAQQVEPQVAPEQTELAADTIHLVGRYVFGQGVDRLHTALYYRIPIVDSPHWLSAFDSDKRTMFDGTLVASTSDPRDNPVLMRLTLGTVESRDGFSPYAYYFARLLPAHKHYEALPQSQMAPYDAIPELPPCPFCSGRNSNGYISGVIAATNGRAVTDQSSVYADLSRLTGWEYPVEAHYFGQ